MLAPHGLVCVVLSPSLRWIHTFFLLSEVSFARTSSRHISPLKNLPLQGDTTPESGNTTDIWNRVLAPGLTSKTKNIRQRFASIFGSYQNIVIVNIAQNFVIEVRTECITSPATIHNLRASHKRMPVGYFRNYCRVHGLNWPRQLRPTCCANETYHCFFGVRSEFLLQNDTLEFVAILCYASQFIHVPYGSQNWTILVLRLRARPLCRFSSNISRRRV